MNTTPKPVHFAVEGGTVLWNSLHDTDDPRYLTADLLLVSLGVDTYIDVDWLPEHDPHGAYHVSFRRHGPDGPFVTIEARSMDEALRYVHAMAKEFGTAAR